jgi:hypothetical protein
MDTFDWMFAIFAAVVIIGWQHAKRLDRIEAELRRAREEREHSSEPEYRGKLEDWDKLNRHLESNRVHTAREISEILFQGWRGVVLTIALIGLVFIALEWRSTLQLLQLMWQ